MPKFYAVVGEQEPDGGERCPHTVLIETLDQTRYRSPRSKHPISKIRSIGVIVNTPVKLEVERDDKRAW